MAFENILTDKSEGIATITISRERQLNALNASTLQELSVVLDEIKADDAIRCVVVSGAGNKAFVAGADITYLKGLSVAEARVFSTFGQGVLRKIELLTKPVIAAVNGYCLGGGLELAMACDFRIAAENAMFGLPEVKLGVIPGFGGTQRLARLIGDGYAKQMILTGNFIDANDAMRVGLVSGIASAADLIKVVEGIAAKITANGPLAVNLAKNALNEGMQMDIDRAMSYEASIFGLCFSTADQKEGMKAFIEKREPHFSGK